MSDSSPILYRFAPVPFEFFSEEFVEDHAMMRFVACMMCRISPYPKKIPLKNSHKHLLLDAFEFMYGRIKFSKEAGITEKNARTRLRQLIGLGYIEEVANKRASSYTVYRIVTTAFTQVSGRLNGQEMEQQEGLHTGHKRKTKIQEKKNIKGTVNDIGSVNSSLSDKQKEDLSVLIAYCSEKAIKIQKPALERWLSQYESEYVVEHFQLLITSKKPIDNPEAWMVSALRRNYVGKNQNIEINRAFSKKLKKDNGWKDLILTKTYCRHEPSGKDYQYDLVPENFQKMLRDCYDQYNT